MVQISRRYRAALVGWRDSSTDLSALTGRTSAEDRAEWETAEREAQEHRREDVGSMDVYDSAMKLR